MINSYSEYSQLRFHVKIFMYQFLNSSPNHKGNTGKHVNTRAQTHTHNTTITGVTLKLFALEPLNPEKTI